VAERMKWPPYGDSEGQKRGYIETGIVNVVESVKFINRYTTVEKDLGEKLKENRKKKNKETLIAEMEDKYNREKKEKMEKILVKSFRPKYKLGPLWVIITGVPQDYDLKDILTRFKKIGEFDRVKDFRSNPINPRLCIRYEQTTQSQKAVETFNDYCLGNCLLSVIRND
jgi:hypothetical protein